MCFGGGGQQAAAMPTAAPPPAPPPVPQAPRPLASQLLMSKQADAGVKPKTSTRARTAMRLGTSQFQIPLNVASGSSTAGGLNT